MTDTITSRASVLYFKKDNMAYQIETKDNILVLRTTSYKAEKGSILRSGIFNRELSSSLAAGAVILFAGFFLGIYAKITAAHFVSAIALFAALFILFRLYLFREPILETVVDREKGIITVAKKKTIGGGTRSYRMNDFSDVRLDHLTLQPDNLDGVRVVEKIALQHGMVIPGFGKNEGFHKVLLSFHGESVVIFATKEKYEAETVVTRIKEFMNCGDSPYSTTRFSSPVNRDSPLGGIPEA